MKGTEAALEEARNQLEGEKIGATVLQRSLDDLKGSLEAEKKRAAEDAISTFKSSEAFEDATLEYYVSGFKNLCRRILEGYPLLDLSMFKRWKNQTQSNERTRVKERLQRKARPKGWMKSLLSLDQKFVPLFVWAKGLIYFFFLFVHAKGLLLLYIMKCPLNFYGCVVRTFLSFGFS